MSDYFANRAVIEKHGVAILRIVVVIVFDSLFVAVVIATLFIFAATAFIVGSAIAAAIVFFIVAFAVAPIISLLVVVVNVGLRFYLVRRYRLIVFFLI